jgi:hypothetical protein
MEKNIGRNESCPCGSKKKYKNCCMAKSSGGSEGAISKKWNDIDVELNRRLFPYLDKECGKSAVVDAWKEFTFGKFEFDAESPHIQTFFPWFFHEWTPASLKTGEELPTLAIGYLERHSERVTVDEKAYILANRGVAYGFWEVLECEPGRGFRMKDVFFGTERDVEERMGSRNARSGDMLFCRVIDLETISVLNGCASFLIPPSHKPELIRIRADMLKTGKRLAVPATPRIMEPTLLHLYWDLLETMMSPPVMANTDGEPIEMHDMEFDIDSPDEAFDRLKSLCVTASTADILEEAERNEKGGIRKIGFDWTRKGNPLHKNWTNTVLGGIRIEGNTLTVSVNSRKRAETIRREIEKRMEGRVRFRNDDVGTMDSLMKSAERTGGRSRKDTREDRELYERPEVRELMRKQLDEHWKNWLHMKLGALGHQTPLQAAKTADGREMIEALFNQMERDDARQESWRSQREYIDRARRELGMG